MAIIMGFGLLFLHTFGVQVGFRALRELGLGFRDVASFRVCSVC